MQFQTLWNCLRVSNITYPAFKSRLIHLRRKNLVARFGNCSKYISGQVTVAANSMYEKALGPSMVGTDLPNSVKPSVIAFSAPAFGRWTKSVPWMLIIWAFEFQDESSLGLVVKE